MKPLFSRLLIFVVFAFLAEPSAIPREPETTEWIDGQLAAAFKADEPGAAVIVVKDTKAVFRKAYGMANLELGVPMRPDMVFRIGSVTKQFTAVAILMLMERGELSLTDEITKFLPDYPTQRKRITVEHLLTHTSGIKGYTEMAEWPPLWRKDLKITELVALFKDVPLEFAPGDQFAYSNSGYILLGAIIEKVTGLTYAEFMERNIFTPLGMRDSFYDSTERIVPRRVPGYDKKDSRYVNCEYLSMTHPHAAGALISTVDDLAKWDEALYTDKLIKQESLAKAWTSFRLNNGQPTKSGYGWLVTTLEDERMLSHNGGVNGFACYTVRLPAAKVYVAILSNRETGASGNLAERIAAKIAGIEIREPVAIHLPSLEKYLGVYGPNTTNSFHITLENGSLFFRRGEKPKQEILPLDQLHFFFKQRPSSRLDFILSEDSVNGLVVRSWLGPDEEAKKN